MIHDSVDSIAMSVGPRHVEFREASPAWRLSCLAERALSSLSTCSSGRRLM
jgi:hypothetical protein